ncbi:alpha/beta fold hydrolase [Nitrincola nitratireducens]|uniref:Acetoin dehydrogenase E2 subunit dihydrolipoyllysine-residue acetyltransferase n=1 Tax=Nitrincola nitratireducens TaxID=1229521 RepID=W9URS3_9GAMM|nr:alpha/beta hydrolase [Nitrincola nitratireducens]EXJ09923.1 acetoin dehydrogenase E2 subunit dihydrolipoyllysine-residue acetyltransferase [Nitrincola nitratireducens]
MRKICPSEKHQLLVPDQRIVYRLYRHPNALSSRRLVLLHGAGVAGQDTWEMLIQCTQQWREILVPDLRGAGETQYFDGVEHPFTLVDLVNDVAHLVDHLDWRVFDLGGYSLGGLVSMLLKARFTDRVEKQYLLESALLDRSSLDDTIRLRDRYSQAAEFLRSQDQEQGIRQFLDTISPNRKTTAQVDDLAVSRLARRPVGFSWALDAVSQGIRQLDRSQLLAAQGDVTSFIGSQSVQMMHQLHLQLAEQMPNWHYIMVPGTDHSLPFQKPRQIARVMNDELLRYLS